MERKQLTALQWAQQTNRLHELYVAEHQETRPVKERGGPGRGKKTNGKTPSVLPFTEETARRLGKSRTTIERSIKLAKDLDAKVQGSKVEESSTLLRGPTSTGIIDACCLGAGLPEPSH